MVRACGDLVSRPHSVSGTAERVLGWGDERVQLSIHKLGGSRGMLHRENLKMPCRFCDGSVVWNGYVRNENQMSTKLGIGGRGASAVPVYSVHGGMIVLKFGHVRLPWLGRSLPSWVQFVFLYLLGSADVEIAVAEYRSEDQRLLNGRQYSLYNGGKYNCEAESMSNRFPLARQESVCFYFACLNWFPRHLSGICPSLTKWLEGCTFGRQTANHLVFSNSNHK